MIKYMQFVIKYMIISGEAKELTTPEQIPRNLERIGYSIGLYGIDGGIIRDRDTGELFAVVNNTTILSRIF